jgi:hypothetical protein
LKICGGKKGDPLKSSDKKKDLIRMFYSSNYTLPFRLPQWFLHLQWIIPVYFISAVVYDIYHIGRHYLN